VGANKSDFTKLAASLVRRGYVVLLFDFRAHGESSGSRTSLGYHEQKDVLAALSILKAREEIDLQRIGIYGFSMGGSTAILTAAQSGAFSAVVADSAFTSLKDQGEDRGHKLLSPSVLPIPLSRYYWLRALLPDTG